MIKKLTLLLTINFAIITTNFSQTKIPLIKKSGVSYLQCELNGVKLDFVFDTGASDICISKTEASFLLKNNHLELNDFLGYEKSQIANGDIIENSVIFIRELKIGKYTLENLKATVINNQNAPLLLGKSVINRFHKVEIFEDFLIFHPKKVGQFKNDIFIKDKILFNLKDKVYNFNSMITKMEIDGYPDQFGYYLFDFNNNGYPELYLETQCGGSGCPQIIFVYEQNYKKQFEYIDNIICNSPEPTIIYTDKVEVIEYDIFPYFKSCGACSFDLPYYVPFISNYELDGNKLIDNFTSKFFNKWLISNLEYLVEKAPNTLEEEWDFGSGYRKAIFSEL